MPTDQQQDEFSDAYEEYKNMIFRHCYFHTFDREIAKDILQDTFIKTWQYLEQGKKIDNMKAFLFRVATNLVINHARKKKSVSLDKMQENGFDPGENDKNLQRDWSDEDRVKKLLGKVEETYRKAITMRYVEGLQPNEIADVLGENANTISVRIHRGLQQLKVHLEND